jgi:type I restriction enzyme S subunit
MKRYDSYKDSGDDWIGEIPSHWSKIKLSMTINTTQGIQVDVPKQRYVKEEGYERFLRISDYTNPNIEHRFVNVPNHINYMVNEDDIVMFRYGESGKVVKGLKGVICNNVFSISSKKHEMSNNYLFEVFSSNDFYELLKSSSNNPTLSQVSHSQIKEQKVPFPPLSEQQQIVSFLDTKTSLIDSLIEKTQRKIELFKEKRTSLINEVVTKGLNPNVEMKDSGVEWIGEIPSHWEESKLKHKGVFFSGYSFDSNDFLSEGEIRVLKISNIQNNGISWDDLQYLPESFYDTHQNFIVNKGDLVFVLTRPIISTGIKVCFFNEEYKTLLNQRNSVFRPNESSVIKRFLFYSVRTFSFIEEFKQQLKETNQPNISTEQISNILMFFPPLSEQQQIVEYLDEQTGLIDKTVSIEEKRIELLKEYRQSLISEVVTGKRKVVEC